MPIYEFACPACRVIFNFFSKRIQPEHTPPCPKCGNKQMTKQISSFAMPRGLKEPASTGSEAEPGEGTPVPDMEDPRVMRAMGELEKDMEHLDESNPKHMAHMMRKMKDLLPAGAMPKEMEIAIKRLEAGEDPDKIEEDMGDLLGDFMEGGAEDEGLGGSAADYTRDSGLYDY